MRNIVSFLIIIILKLFACKAQNLVNNPNFESYITYNDSNNNIVYAPKYWYYNIKERTHPIYFSANRFLDKRISNNYHPESKLIQEGKMINFVSLPLLPDPKKVYTELNSYPIAGETYHFKMKVKAAKRSNCLSDIFIGFKDSSNYNSDSLSSQLQLTIPDSVSNEYMDS